MEKGGIEVAKADYKAVAGTEGDPVRACKRMAPFMSG